MGPRILRASPKPPLCPTPQQARPPFPPARLCSSPESMFGGPISRQKVILSPSPCPGSSGVISVFPPASLAGDLRGGADDVRGLASPDPPQVAGELGLDGGTPRQDPWRGKPQPSPHEEHGGKPPGNELSSRDGQGRWSASPSFPPNFLSLRRRGEGCRKR